MRENIGIYRGKRTDTGEWKEGYLLGVQDRVTGKDLFSLLTKATNIIKLTPRRYEFLSELRRKNDSKAIKPQYLNGGLTHEKNSDTV